MKLQLFLNIIIFDQFSKYLINQNITNNSFYDFLPFIKIINIKNSGISFGLFANVFSPIIFKLVIGCIIFFLILWFFNSKNNLEKWGLITVLGGAFGNFIDRIIFNEVTDFIFFYYNDYFWPAFNIADISISVGVILMIFATYNNYIDSVKRNNE